MRAVSQKKVGANLGENTGLIEYDDDDTHLEECTFTIEKTGIDVAHRDAPIHAGAAIHMLRTSKGGFVK